MASTWRLHRCISISCRLSAFMFAALAAAAYAPAADDPFLKSSYFSSDDVSPTVATAYYDGSPLADEATVVVTDAVSQAGDVALTNYAATYGAPNLDAYSCQRCGVHWQLLPEGLIYRSYMAGPREPRIATTLFHNSNTLANSEFLWDGTVGGRRGLVRYGTNDPLRPQGWQIDIEGAALVRLNIDEERDLDASDFRFGVPITYGAGRFEFKTGYYHISSHLGDELTVRTVGAISRVNYVRDAILLGVSFNPTPAWRVYGETAYSVFTAGGAEPWEFQFGVEYAQPGPTSRYGTPFFATNAHLREEVNFGGDWTTQLGWLWRGDTGSTIRLGLHYVNGKSTQYQFFNSDEEQIGIGAWVDF